jgi:hypothetical protein
MKMRWISLLAILHKCSMSKKLLVKINDDAITTPSFRANYELLCEVKTIMGLTCALPMLETIQNLNKLAQNKDKFICDCNPTIQM